MESNDLGELRDSSSRLGFSAPASERSDSSDDNWDPDSDARGVAAQVNPEHARKTRTWNLLVVNDESVVNAMASYGELEIRVL